MGDGVGDVRTDRWFDPLLRGLPARVRSRVFNPSYEDLRHDIAVRVGSARWPGRVAILRAWFALRVLALIIACYRDSPGFVFVHPFRAAAAAVRALAASNRALLAHDVRQASRLLVHQPLFSCVAIAILALGIGASTAIFNIVDAVLLQPLPFPDAARLVSIEETLDGRPTAVSPVNFLDWRGQAKSSQDLAIYRASARVSLSSPGFSLQSRRCCSGVFRHSRRWRRRRPGGCRRPGAMPASAGAGACVAG